ncbi:MAG: phosphatase PAP2 family protein [Gammaproteobacteria bacterium]|nr:phosphatase PAP2 family protein [Gammaproteobacteria bacterium]
MKALFFVLLINTVFSINAIASPYKLDRNTDSWIIGSSIAMLGAGSYLDSQKSEITTQKIESLRKSSVPAIDREYAGRWNPVVSKQSDYYLAASMLVPGIHLVNNSGDFSTLAVIVLESFLVNNALTSLSKGLVTRYRPYVYGSDAPVDKKLDAYSRRSFFSGHASNITNGWMLSAKIYSDYNPTSKYLNYVWGGAFAAAAYGSWLRVEAGQHFPTDVLAGMLTGASVAYLIPELHKNEHSFFVLPFRQANALGVTLNQIF